MLKEWRGRCVEGVERKTGGGGWGATDVEPVDTKQYLSMH